MTATDTLVVLCTFPSAEVAGAAAERLVDERLAACVNLVPGVTSIYRWEGEVTRDQELLAIIKTASDRFEALRARLVELHPYDTPEVIAWPLERGHGPYLDWVRGSTRPA